MKVVHRLVSKIGPLVNSESFNGVDLPTDPETGDTLGFAFVEYQSINDASQAVKSLSGYAFDKNHTLSVVPYSDAVQLKDLGDEFAEPEPAPFEERIDTNTWLLDPSQRDQFVIRQGKETIVNWSDARNPPIVDYDGSREKEAGV